MNRIADDILPRVLLVDDEKNVLKSLSIGLGRYPYDVRLAGSGPEALRLMRETPCDFLVSDIRMKPMDGYDLAQKAHDDFPNTTIVLMSAYGFNDEPVCDAASFVRHKLTKPFHVSDLVEIIRRVTRAKGFALVFSEDETGDDICRVLCNAGYRTMMAVESPGFEGGLEWNAYDLFFVDAAFLNGNKWTTLNAIDRHAAKKPVFLLSNRQGHRDVMATPDVSVTILDKDRFIKDQAWVEDVLRDAGKTSA